MALQPHELKALALELAASMPPPRSKTLGEVLADAFDLEPVDREVVERFMRAARVSGLDMDRESLRHSDESTLRKLWGLQ